MPFYWCSVGFRQVQWRSAVIAFLSPMVSWGVAKFRGFPLCPISLLRAPTFRPQTNTMRFQTAETSGIAEWGGGGLGNERIDSAKTANRGIWGDNALLLAFRQVPWGPARFRGVPQWSVAPTGISHRPYIPPAHQYRVFRNRRSAGFL